GRSGRRALTVSFTCSSRCLKGSIFTRASSIAISIRCAGWGCPVWGLTEFRAMKLITWRRFSSIICLRWSAVRWISPFSMIFRATALKSVVWKTFISASSDARVAFEAFPNTLSAATTSSISTGWPCRTSAALSGSTRISKRSPKLSSRATTECSSGIMRSRLELFHERCDFFPAHLPERRLLFPDDADLDCVDIELALGCRVQRLQAQKDRVLDHSLGIVFLFKDFHRGRAADADTGCLVLEEGTRGIRLKEPAFPVTDSRDQECSAVRADPAVLGEVLHVVAELFGERLDFDRFVVGDTVDLAFYAGAVHQCTCIPDKTGGCNADVLIDLEDLLD